MFSAETALFAGRGEAIHRIDKLCFFGFKIPRIGYDKALVCGLAFLVRLFVFYKLILHHPANKAHEKIVIAQRVSPDSYVQRSLAMREHLADIHLAPLGL